MIDTNTVGITIAKLRHEKQAKQEELANYVGVSIQAVSKWENGGTPDIDLLPQIADFFGTSIDALFGRKPIESGYLWHSLVEAVSDSDDKLEKAFNVCQMLVQALQADNNSCEPETIELGKDGLTEQLISVQRNCGFAELVVTHEIPYFLIIPDYSDSKAKLFDMDSLPFLFADLGDVRFFKTLVYLNSRDSNKAFSSNLLVNKLGFTESEAKFTIEKLLRYHLLSSTTVEIDEEESIMYNLERCNAFNAMLRFARKLPQPTAKYDSGTSQA